MISHVEHSCEVSIQLSEAFRAILQSVPWGIVVADQHGRLRFCNPAAEKILGVGLLEPAPDTCASLAGWFLPDQRTLLSSDQLPMARAIRGEELTDELFFVIDGALTIQLRDGDVVLGPGELFVVPKGAEHCPRADAEAAIMLIEPRGVVNTGDVGGDLTAEVETLS